jgi:hypothetical protein
MVASNPPHTMATARGHQARIRSGIRTTNQEKRRKKNKLVAQQQQQASTASAAPAEALPHPHHPSLQYSILAEDSQLAFNDEDIFVKVIARDGVIGSDLPGRLPFTSRHGSNYMMVSTSMLNPWHQGMHPATSRP